MNGKVWLIVVVVKRRITIKQWSLSIKKQIKNHTKTSCPIISMLKKIIVCCRCYFGTPCMFSYWCFSLSFSPSVCVFTNDCFKMGIFLVISGLNCCCKSIAETMNWRKENRGNPLKDKNCWFKHWKFKFKFVWLKKKNMIFLFCFVFLVSFIFGFTSVYQYHMIKEWKKRKEKFLMILI